MSDPKDATLAYIAGLTNACTTLSALALQYHLETGKVKPDDLQKVLESIAESSKQDSKKTSVAREAEQGVYRNVMHLLFDE